MKKSYLLVAAAALAMASCTNDELNVGGVPQTGQLPEGGVGFDAYAQRGVTRGGQTGVMTLENLKKSEAEKGGFGVFAYYTDNNDYEQSRIPDFMYNQGVFFNGAYWAYEPIKYWPNEYGSNAISDDFDRVSYFAYAPYVGTNGNGKINKETGSDEDKWGITGMSRNSSAGDPIIKYIGSFEADKSVDLLWGVCDNPTWKLVQGSSQQINEGTVGLPWLNVQRPYEAETQANAQQRILFTFKHALTQLSVNIDAIVDEIYKGSNKLDSRTKIYVRQISFTGVALKGALNLNNETPNKALWLDYNGLSDIESGAPIVLYDGLKDGKEGTVGSNASNEKTRGLNPAVISNEGNTTDGVTEETRQLFATDPVMLIPTGEDMEIEIVYDVETKDDNLATLLSDGKTHGSSIENRIKKTIKFSENNLEGGLQSGMHYTINLHLGMNSVKFDVADVSDWSGDQTKIDVDLPSNDGGSVGAVNDVLNTPLASFPIISLDQSAQVYNFTVTGLKPGEKIKTQLDGDLPVADALIKSRTDKAQVTIGSTLGGSDNVANDAGVVYVKVELSKNPTVHKLESKHYLLIQGEESLSGTKARFEQAAQPFGLHVQKVENSSAGIDEITIKATNTDLANAGEAITGGTIGTEISGMNYGWATAATANALTVKVNGKALTYTSSTPSAEQYKYDNSDAITLPTLKAGDKVEITITATDASGNLEENTETVSFTVGGISFGGASQTLTYSTSAQALLVPSMYGVTAADLTYTEEESVITISGANGITTETHTSTGKDVSCKVTKANVAGGDYFFTESSSEDVYGLTILAQATTTAFAATTEVMTSQDVSVGRYVVDLSGATYKASVTGNIDGNTISDPDVTYEIVSITAGGSDAAGTFVMAADKTTVNVGTSPLTHNETYILEIKAKYAGDPGKYAASESAQNLRLSVTAIGE